ncbi:MAG: DUF1684 domain-containing protein [Actinomycetota bacterium]
MPTDVLDLADYRRRVAAIYADVRSVGVGEASWHRWAEARAALLRSHPQSPLAEADRATPNVPGYAAYDPSWSLVGSVEPLDPASTTPAVHEDASRFRPVATVRTGRFGEALSLTLFWLETYGGGLFLPFGDTTNGRSTYGGGRYLLDSAKSADLGSPGPGLLTLDFNFAYHPSCLWDPQWPCPLPPPENRLNCAVVAGELAPSAPV